MKTGAISRRRTTRAGVSLLGAATLISMNVAPSVHARSLAAPKYGGTFQVQGGQPDCLDPQKTGLSASNAIFSLVVDPLISFDKKGHYAGGPRTEMEVQQWRQNTHALPAARCEVFQR